ncbi:hypothetical protein [Silvibacterium sp.]|uniref:hypothetical protein n=1 Tax=Silvibacterium sp. TaxID=1964179 RepID=UPI0039E430FA
MPKYDLNFIPPTPSNHSRYRIEIHAPVSGNAADRPTRSNAALVSHGYTYVEIQQVLNTLKISAPRQEKALISLNDGRSHLLEAVDVSPPRSCRCLSRDSLANWLEFHQAVFHQAVIDDRAPGLDGNNKYGFSKGCQIYSGGPVAEERGCAGMTQVVDGGARQFGCRKGQYF